MGNQKRKLCAKAVAAWLAILWAVGAAATQISVGPNVQVSAARADLAHNEVQIAADENHPGRLLACSMLLTSLGTNSAVYVSFDNGQTWEAPVVTQEHFADDPVCAYGPDGGAYLIAKTGTKTPRRGSDFDALYIYRSSDGGKTWEPVIHSIFANDRPFMAIDKTPGRNRGRLYVSFNSHVHGELATTDAEPDQFRNTVRLATSTDGGRTFQYIYDRAMLEQGGEVTTESLVNGVVVLSDGTVAILHETRHKKGLNPATGKGYVSDCRLQVFLSKDGGESLETALRVAPIVDSYNLGNSRGVTGSLAVDSSPGKFRDHLYAVWADVSSGHARILLSYSADKGSTWSTPKMIDDGEVRSLTKSFDNFMPEIAVNAEGIVGVQWYDRGDNPDNRGYYARFSASVDGGHTWAPSVRVSLQPNKPPETASKSAYFVTGGDTAGLTVDSTGVFHALWIDNRTGVEQVWTAPIHVRP